MNDQKLFNFELLKEFDNHRVINYLSDEEGGLKAFVVIHRGGLKLPAFGATRIFNYPSETEAVEDALKLSRIMSYKSAMSDLQYGGAKAVIIADIKSPTQRKKLLKVYARTVNFLKNHFVTGADVGVEVGDLSIMAKEYPDIVGLKGDAVKFTALGVFFSIQICLKELFGSQEISGKAFAIQGLGKIGSELLKLLYNETDKIYVSDIDSNRIKSIRANFPNVTVVDPDDIYSQKVDVFCPCALSSTINTKTISKLNCNIIVGSANGQLENEEMGVLLKKLGILYGPDYIVNSGGLITVVDEYENHHFDESRVIKKIQNIPKILKKVIGFSVQENNATNLVADKMAQIISSKFI